MISADAPPQETTEAGPTIREAVAVFDDAESFESAIDELLSAGFDRAEVSLLAGEKAVREKLGHLYEAVEELEDDPDTPRTAFVPRTTIAEAEGAAVSLPFLVGAMAAAGAVVASGGTVVAAILGAAAAGGATGLAGGILAKAIGNRHARHLQHQLDHGGLLLWVRVRDDAHETRALEVLKRHSAHDVHVHEIPA